MTGSYAIYGKTWESHNGKTVVLDGLKYRIKVSMFEARYPYPETKLTVDAVPLSRSSPHYREVKAVLGDDWSTDVLASDVELQADVLQQCLAQN